MWHVSTTKFTAMLKVCSQEKKKFGKSFVRVTGFLHDLALSETKFKARILQLPGMQVRKHAYEITPWHYLHDYGFSRDIGQHTGLARITQKFMRDVGLQKIFFISRVN